MVYLGRPSRGCQACKTRRIKCDETRPACQNCIKTSRECPGLPTEADLIFRTVSPGTRRKTKPRSRKGSQGTESGESQSLSPGIEEQRTRLEQPPVQTRTNHDKHNRSAIEATQWTLIAAGQTVPIKAKPTHVRATSAQVRRSPASEKQATASTNEICTPPTQNEGTSKAFEEALRPLLAESPKGSPLTLATQAASLADMAQQPAHQHLASHAQNAYTSALHALQQDLNIEALALSDATLLTVLTFARYEITTPSEQSRSGWAKHMFGAITLLKTRRGEDLNDERSHGMFRAIRGQMLAGVGPRGKAYVESLGSGVGGDEAVGEEDRVAMRMRRVLGEYQEYLQSGEYGV